MYLLLWPSLQYNIVSWSHNQLLQYLIALHCPSSLVLPPGQPFHQCPWPHSTLWSFQLSCSCPSLSQVNAVTTSCTIFTLAIVCRPTLTSLAWSLSCSFCIGRKWFLLVGWRVVQWWWHEVGRALIIVYVYMGMHSHTATTWTPFMA